jgi:UDP-N-acetylglucosamine--N-acetylmuramyl-(pentapeptide) pyrophosphoryl-undecaprenol N-acetylglucosamine transferase
MRVIICAGGTGGHIYPGIAIAEEIRSRDPNGQIAFIGSREGLEGELIKREGFEIKLISARGLLRKLSYKAISAPFVSLLGFFQSLSILNTFKPQMVVVTGGYVSFPVIAAAKVLNLPILLHEQNVLPGFTTRFWSSFVKILTVSFPETQKYLNGTVTGNPVRQRILKLRRKSAERPTVLVLGGSQGARSVNSALISQIEKLKEYQVIHITGERDYKILKLPAYPFYQPLPYMYNIEEGLAVADLVVSRAGATAISEILAVGLPSILIPFPYSAEGHQDLNAQVLQTAGAATILADSELNKLADTISNLVKDKARLQDMGAAARKLARRDAAGKIVDLIYAIS